MIQVQDKMRAARQGVKMGLNLGVMPEGPNVAGPLAGHVIFEMRDGQTNDILVSWESDNVIVRDAGILAARLFRNSLDPNPAQNNGLTMLAIGTGATGNILSPDAPQATQRRLNTEIARKAFASVVYRNGDGIAVAYPTNIVDFTATFGEAEAVGPLNEMALMCAASSNPNVTNPIVSSPANYDATVDVTGKDILGNYLTFGVVTKPNTAILSVTWRLTF